MAHITSSPVVFDCGTCSKPVYYNAGVGTWKHSDRRATCAELVVVTVELTKVVSPVGVDSYELVA